MQRLTRLFFVPSQRRFVSAQALVSPSPTLTPSTVSTPEEPKSSPQSASSPTNQPVKLQVKTVDLFESDIVLRRFLQFHFSFGINEIEMLVRKRKVWVLRPRTGANIFSNNSHMTAATYENDDKKMWKRIKVDSKMCLKEGDRVHVLLPTHMTRPVKKSIDEIFTAPPILAEHRKEVLDAVLYRDQDIIVLNKPPNIPMHGGTNSPIHIRRFFDALKTLDGDDVGSRDEPRIVHRLDKKASGLVILARNRKAAVRLSEMFREASDPKDMMLESVPSMDAFGNIIDPKSKLLSEDELEQRQQEDKSVNEDVSPYKLSIDKAYWALLTDLPSQTAGTIDRHLFISPEANIDISDELVDLGSDVPKEYQVTLSDLNKTSPYYHHCLKRAISHYEVLDYVGRKGAWVRLCPETGRKHQLRVHCAKVLKAPILGDFKYGIKSFKKLHEIGWGQVLDLGKWTGFKQVEQGMPLFLHLRQIRIKNYFMNLGAGGKGIDGLEERRRVAGTFLDGKGDLVLTASLPPLWRAVMKELRLDSSRKV